MLGSTGFATQSIKDVKLVVLLPLESRIVGLEKVVATTILLLVPLGNVTIRTYYPSNANRCSRLFQSVAPPISIESLLHVFVKI